MPKAKNLPPLREMITFTVLKEVDQMVFAQRDKGAHKKDSPYSAEWIWALTKHPKTRHLFKDEVLNV